MKETKIGSMKKKLHFIESVVRVSF